MSLIEAQIAHEASLRYEARRCTLCESDATVACWFEHGCYRVIAITYCEPCASGVRPKGKKERKRVKWHEEPFTPEDVEVRFQRSLKERPCAYVSTVQVIA